MDIISEEKRSWNMSRIRSKNTRPELVVRSFLHRKGFRFCIHKASLPGKPDIVLKKYRAVIFVHGCFWHRHRGCKHAYNPKSSKKFWNEKFQANLKRFFNVKRQLVVVGWRVFVIWECQVNNKKILNGIINFLKEGN